MNALLFLTAGAGIIMVGAIKDSASLKQTLGKHSRTFRLLPQAVTLLILGAQFSELLKIIEHLSIVNLVAALLLLAIVAAAKSGTESELG